MKKPQSVLLYFQRTYLLFQNAFFHRFRFLQDLLGFLDSHLMANTRQYEQLKSHVLELLHNLVCSIFTIKDVEDSLKTRILGIKTIHLTT